jgi:anti-anti-sigma factor
VSNELQVSVSRSPGGVTVIVAGEIDKANADRFRRELDTLTGEDPITIDLTEVTYLDSSGVAVLFDRVGRGTTRIVAGSRCRVRSVMEITGLPLQAIGDTPS